MKEKIGIITVHNNTNYGANLQAFASCKYLQKCGYDSRVIDYSIPSHLKQTRLLSWLKVSWDAEHDKSLVRKIKLGIALGLSAPWKHKRLKNFRKFRGRYITLSGLCNDVHDVEALELDTIVCGSDQIWNPAITEGINPIFFSAVDGVKKRISYAASVGKDKYEPADEVSAIELVRALDYRSVRESQTADYLSSLIGEPITTVCDPVFLLDKEDYDTVAAKRLIKSKYILLYSIIQDEKMTDVAKKYADARGLKLVEICSGKDKNAKHQQILSYGPSEFLSAFKYADAVITNSFHGTAFSIIFEKNFYIFDNKHGGSRITNLLDKAGLLSRLISSPIDEEHQPIDYATVRENLREYVDSSKQFLKTALASEKIDLAEDKCVGCGACATVCAKGAIRVIKNGEGFLHAYVDSSKCVDCGLCKKACPALNDPEKHSISEDVLAFKAEDAIRKNSTSGGAFAALARAVLAEGGVFYGAKLEDNRRVRHVRGATETDILSMQGTKYVQSDMTESLSLIAEDLKSDTLVLFSGTPCQVDAVNRFVEARRLPKDKLITVDIICHGVPSPKIYGEYIDWLVDEIGTSVEEYKFRSKKISWRGNSCMAILTDGREVKNDKRLNGFMNLYYSDNITNKSCYNCQYTSTERVSDITISDYWGIESILPEFEDALGVSMVILNTDKGNELFAKVYGERGVGSLTGVKQPQLSFPTKLPDTRTAFWSEYRDLGLKSVLKTYGGVKKDSIKQKIYNLIKG